MKIKPIANNMTELTTENGTSVLFSYKTPVAGWDDIGAFRTAKHYSPTTTRHIDKYLGGKDMGRVVEQDYINSLA
jgi:hypothetical protein